MHSAKYCAPYLSAPTADPTCAHRSHSGHFLHFLHFLHGSAALCFATMPPTLLPLLSSGAAAGLPWLPSSVAEAKAGAGTGTGADARCSSFRGGTLQHGDLFQPEL